MPSAKVLNAAARSPAFRTECGGEWAVDAGRVRQPAEWRGAHAIQIAEWRDQAQADQSEAESA
jgi:hypothetical protein